MSEPSSVDPGASPVRREERPPATPRWVKIAGAVIALVVLAVLVKALVDDGTGGHGPGMHGGLGSSAAAPAIRALPAL